MMKVSRPARVLWLSSAGLVVIKLLQERNRQKTTNLQSLVILKQKRMIKEDIENECTNTG